jgi:hypothetical protein
MNKVADTLMAYQFIKRLVMPFDKWEAFKKGVIDAHGKVLIQRNKFTPEQAAVFGKFDVLVLNLKKLLAKLPGGSTRIATIAAAIMLLREKQYDENNVDLLREELDNHIVALKMDEITELSKTPLIEARRNLGSKLCSCGGDLHTREHKCAYDEAQDKVVWKNVRKCSNCGKETEVRKKAPSAAIKARHDKNEETIKWLMKEGVDLQEVYGPDEVKKKKAADNIWSLHRDGKHIGHLKVFTTSQNNGRGRGTKEVKQYGFHKGTSLPGIYDRGDVHHTSDSALRAALKTSLQEDMGVAGNSAGAGAVAGIGVGPKGEPGMTPPGKKRKFGELPKSNLMTTMMTRKSPKSMV